MPKGASLFHGRNYVSLINVLTSACCRTVVWSMVSSPGTDCTRWPCGVGIKVNPFPKAFNFFIAINKSDLKKY